MSGTSSIFYTISGMITSVIIIAKFNGGFENRWEYVVSPMLFTLSLGAIAGIFGLLSNQKKQVVVEEGSSPYLQYHLEKRLSFNTGLAALDPILAIAVLIQFADFANRLQYGHEKHPNANMLGLTLVVSLLISMLYRMEREKHNESIKILNYEGETAYLDWKKNNRFPILGIIFNQIFNLLGASTMVCAGGACNSLYISTITMFFSSVGISLTDWVPYLNGLGFGFVLFALISLYSAKKSLFYPPFLIGFVCCVVILLNLLKVYENIYSLVIANVGLVVCSCLNLKMNPAAIGTGKRRRKKKKLEKTPLPI